MLRCCKSCSLDQTSYFNYVITLYLFLTGAAERTGTASTGTSFYFYFNFYCTWVFECTSLPPLLLRKFQLHTEPKSQIVSSTEFLSIVRSRNMFAFSSDERAFNIESFSHRYCRPFAYVASRFPPPASVLPSVKSSSWAVLALFWKH